MQNASYTAQEYRRQQILTASPEMLTLMLYNGAIRFINEGIKFIGEEQKEKSNASLLRAQDVMIELMSSLNMEYEIANELYPLYDYIYRALIVGNLANNIEKLEEAKELILELRDTWNEAMKKAAEDKDSKK